MNQVTVSPKAEDAYLAILEYYYHFSIDFALKLEEKLDRLIENLRRFKKLWALDFWVRAQSFYEFWNRIFKINFQP
jgi:plasmid stabilization system protein ParE